jgi:hypothetical protein
MAITAALCNSYKGEIMQGIHLAADVYKIALYVSAATLDKTTTVYSATNEVANGNGYATGGATLSGFAVVQVGDRQVLKFTDQAWAAATITARGALIYNSTRSNKAVAVLYFGASDITSTNGQFLVDLGQAIATAQSITFTAPSTITRAAGSFVSDGFVAGHTIVTDARLFACLASDQDSSDLVMVTDGLGATVEVSEGRAYDCEVGDAICR